MVKIGILGDTSTDKVYVLRSLVKLLNLSSFKFNIIRVQFNDEENLNSANNNEEEISRIYPNRIIFQEVERKMTHTIFAPIGDVHGVIIKMEIITISRIASHIIALFTLKNDIEEQFEVYKYSRFLPDNIHILIDLKGVNNRERINQIEQKIVEFFTGKKIKVRSLFEFNSYKKKQIETYAYFIIRLCADCELHTP